MGDGFDLENSICKDDPLPAPQDSQHPKNGDDDDVVMPEQVELNFSPNSHVDSVKQVQDMPDAASSIHNTIMNEMAHNFHTTMEPLRVQINTTIPNSERD